jgi:DNA-binding LytR/AlgR family response regulator
MRVGGRNINFDSRNVMYFEGVINYSLVHFHNKKQLYARGLAYLEKNVPEGFIRIHRSYLVNSSAIKSVDGLMVTLNNGQTLPISRRKLKNLQP